MSLSVPDSPRPGHVNGPSRCWGGGGVALHMDESSTDAGNPNAITFREKSRNKVIALFCFEIGALSDRTSLILPSTALQHV